MCAMAVRHTLVLVWVACVVRVSGYGLNLGLYQTYPVPLLEGTSELRSFTVFAVLQTLPTGDVYVNATVPPELTRTGTALPYVYTPANYYTTKSISISAPSDDGESIGTKYYNVTFSILQDQTDDEEYKRLADETLTFAVYDLNQSVIVARGSTSLGVEGSSIQWSFNYGRAPVGDVWLNFTGDTSRVTCSTDWIQMSAIEMSTESTFQEHSSLGYYTVTCTSVVVAGYNYPTDIPFPFAIDPGITADEGYKTAILASTGERVLNQGGGSGPSVDSIDVVGDGSTENIVSVSAGDYSNGQTAVMNVSFTSNLNNTSPSAVEWNKGSGVTLDGGRRDIRFTALPNLGYTTEHITLTTDDSLTTANGMTGLTYTITVNVESPCLANYGLDPVTNSCLPCAAGYAKHTVSLDECEYVWGCSDDLSLGKFQPERVVTLAAVGFGVLIGAVALNWAWSTGASPFVEQKGVPLGATPPLTIIALASLVFAITLTLAATEAEGYEGRDGLASAGTQTAFITAAWLQFTGALLAVRITTLLVSHACTVAAWVTFAVALSYSAPGKAYVASIFVGLAAAQVFLPHLSLDPRHPAAEGLRGSLTLVTMAVLTGLGLALTLFIHTPC